MSTENEQKTTRGLSSSGGAKPRVVGSTANNYKLKIKYMKVVHNFPKEVTDTFKAIGIIVNELDEHENTETYYNLPQWFKEVNGHIFECPFSELPEQAKHIHLSYRDYQRVFSLDEMKACALAMANWGEGFEGALTPNEYFKQVLGIDISETVKP